MTSELGSFEQIGGQIGGGLLSDNTTARSCTLLELVETNAEAAVKVASANVKVIKIGFIFGFSLYRKFRISYSGTNSASKEENQQRNRRRYPAKRFQMRNAAPAAKPMAA
jgi:hypothetical protein